MSMLLLPREGPGDASSISRASQACSTCRKQKRKCDKILPACGLCSRMGRLCDYSDSQPAPTADDLAALQVKLMELEDRLNSQNSPPPSSKMNGRDSLWLSGPSKFPSELFLDSDVFMTSETRIPPPPVDVPVEVLEQLLSEGSGVQEIVAEYFATIHPWFPIISKKRLSLGQPLWDGGPDLAMLFLAMKLIISYPEEGVASADNPIYTTSKRYLSLLESSGTVTLCYLQSLLLVALYEYSHAIYPAAWMTVGACARYADMLGLPMYADTTIVLGHSNTWTETEERRRTWWGTFILDRIITLGSRKRFAAPEPRDTEILPVDDVAWDAGDPAQAHQRPVTTPYPEAQTAFARTAQAAHLISRATAHVRVARAGTSPINISEATTLTETFAQLCSLLDSSAPSPTSPMAAPRSLLWSGLILLLDAYSCPENQRDAPLGGRNAPKSAEELAMQVQSVEGLSKVSQRVRQFGVELRHVVDEGGAGRVSPFVLDGLYCAMAVFHWLWSEGGDAEVERSLDDTRRTLACLSGRWRAAAAYLSMERYHGFNVNMRGAEV